VRNTRKSIKPAMAIGQTEPVANAVKGMVNRSPKPNMREPNIKTPPRRNFKNFITHLLLRVIATLRIIDSRNA